MIATALDIAFLLVGAALLLAAWRLFRGPDLLDRALALDTMTVNSAALLVLHGVRMGHADDYELAVLIALLGLLGSVAIGRYLSRGRLFG
jgi:multicomponent K+:H+ antiporter subunit F